MSEANESEDVKAARILVIDDEEVIHASLIRLLGKQGHQVDAVLTAREGLEKLKSGGYDMVITDLMMPEINGLELLEQLKERGVDLPVLMITGYPTIKTAMQAMRLGAVDYLAKPFRRKELLAPVNRMLRRGAREPTGDGAPGEQETNGPKAGDRYVLHDHAWADFQQDGTAKVGIERSFLDNTGTVTEIILPHEAELIEQGYVGIRLKTAGREEHGVFMPLSGQVMATNSAAAADPDGLDSETWLIQVIPSHITAEMAYLMRQA